MKLRNSKRAVVDIAKLRDYCLNMGHPEGRYKARVFRAVLGMTRDDCGALQAALLAAARAHNAVAAQADEFGERYVVDFALRRAGREALVRSAWIVRKGENFPRLTSCYILRGL